ncbi:Uma2 family endonuclease [filamentous cyanobacterium LEGE 07170]|nr:Uma2 family endonuclease [filamentous cyanobacterium LEGE 07170]
MYDLPSEFPEEPGLPDVFHDLQPQLLSRTLRLRGYGRDRYFTASDLNIYYDVHHPIWHKRPDWFLAVNVPPLYEGRDLRNSYVVWQEGEHPFVIVELLSPGTQAEDLGRFGQAQSPETTEASPTTSNGNGLIPAPPTNRANREIPPGKLEAYEQYLRVPHYFVYSRYTGQLRYFKLAGGSYQEQALNDGNPIAWIADLGLGLGIWEGEFEGIQARWLRWCDRAGNWFLTDTEQAEQQAAQERAERAQVEQQVNQERLAREQAEQQAEQERQAREQAEAQLLQAAQNLLATGMTLEQIAQVLNLSEAQIQMLQS